MAISELINNVTSSVKGLGSALGLISGESDPNYPVFPDFGIDSIDNSTKERWFNYETDRYVFGVIKDGDSFDGEGVAAVKSIISLINLFGGTLEGGAGAFDDFKLPLTPQEITQVENFATSIKPSQGGTIVQHSGNRYKDLVISGTTGVHPFRGIAGVSKFSGKALNQPDTLKYRSGYEVFIHFRNWLKSYVQTKSIGGDKTQLRLIFKNFKDWEFLIVEPLKFTMKRDASRPLLYNYSIQFKVLGHYSPKKPNLNFLDHIDNGIKVAKKSFDIATSILDRYKSIISSSQRGFQNVRNDIRLAELSIKATLGMDPTIKDISSKIEKKYLSQRDAINLLLKLSEVSKNLDNSVRSFEEAGTDVATTPEDPAALARSLKNEARGSGSGTKDFVKAYLSARAKLGNAVDNISIDDYPEAARRALLEEQEFAALFSRTKIQNVRSSIESLKNSFADSVGLNDVTYDEIYGLTSTGDTSPESENTTIEFEILYGLQRAIEGLDSILSTDEMFDINSQLYSRADSNSGVETIGAGVFSFPDPNAGIREGIIPVGATLEDIALAELGNANRWTELAELNGLKHPYIDNSGAFGKKVNYVVKSADFSDPSDIQGIVAGSYYLVRTLPTPTGGWLGKAGKLAQYLGSDQTLVENWRFISAPVGTVIEIADREEHQELDENLLWIDIEVTDLQTSEVLKPGDIIKIPSSGNTAPRSFIRGPRDNPVIKNLSGIEKNMAVDLKITNTGDLDLSPKGDLAYSFGLDNAAQAIVLKLFYEKGELKKHPEIGTQIKVGGKIPNVAKLRTQIAVSLLQDERIRDVKNINIRQVNSGMEVSFDVFLIEVQEPVPITIPI